MRRKPPPPHPAIPHRHRMPLHKQILPHPTNIIPSQRLGIRRKPHTQPRQRRRHIPHNPVSITILIRTTNILIVRLSRKKSHLRTISILEEEIQIRIQIRILRG